MPDFQIVESFQSAVLTCLDCELEYVAKSPGHWVLWVKPCEVHENPS